MCDINNMSIFCKCIYICNKCGDAFEFMFCKLFYLDFANDISLFLQILNSKCLFEGKLVNDDFM